jgi:hypothetical protein
MWCLNFVQKLSCFDSSAKSKYLGNNQFYLAPRHSRDTTTTQCRGTKLSRTRHSAAGCCTVHGMHPHHVSDAHLRFICWRYFIVIVFCSIYCKYSILLQILHKNIAMRYAIIFVLVGFNRKIIVVCAPEYYACETATRVPAFNCRPRTRLVALQVACREAIDRIT